jgi:hypothetical protein
METGFAKGVPISDRTNHSETRRKESAEARGFPGIGNWAGHFPENKKVTFERRIASSALL